MNGIIYNCTARGKLKTEETKPIVGDNVEIEIIDKEQAVINKIIERKNFMKRPKVSNITQVIFVIACKMPKPNLLMLDKWISYAEYQKITPIIVINKTDLNKQEAERIYKLYKQVRI